MKKLFALILFAASFPALAFAWQMPQDRDGESAWSVKDVGVRVFYSSGTESPYLITGGTSALASGAGVKGSSIAIYGILTSTPQGTSLALAYNTPGFVELRATDTANTTSELLIPPVNIGTFLSSAVANSPDGTQTLSPANVFIVFDPPVIAQDNVSVNASSSASGGLHVSNKFAFSVFYRILDTATAEDVWFPTDDYQGKKAHDAGMYGVKPSSVSTSGGTAEDDSNGTGTEGWDFTTGRRGTNMISTATNLSSTDNPMFYYGWSVSSGAATGYFVCVDSNSALGTPTENFLPPIYPRTFDRPYLNTANFVNFQFPWPLKMQNGLVCTNPGGRDRYRHYTRQRRALR